MGSKEIPQLLIPEPDQQRVEVCDICGDAGVKDVILTCPRCKTSREHAYCRRNFSWDFHDDWSCDDCMGDERGSYNVSQDIENTVNSKSLSSIVRHRGVEKTLTKDKVKCIPTEEAIKLSSGSKRGEGPVRIIKTQVHQKDISLTPSTTSLALPGNKQTGSAIQGQGRRISYVPKEMRAVQAIRKELTESIKSVATTTPAITKDASLVRETNRQRDALSSPAPKKLCTGVSSVQPAAETSLARKRKEASVPKEASSVPFLKKPSTSGHRVSGELPPGVNNSEPKISEPEAAKLSRVPARDPTWKGRFEILVGAFHHVYFLFEAHPCSRGSRKVLDLSKRMPQLLQFTMIQQEEVWKNLFQNQCPDVDDIGLYFFSREYKRTSECDLIHAFIESQDFAMRCVLGGVDLYIFTSKNLPANYQKLDNDYFLWGVFHEIGKKKNVAQLYKELPSAVHKPSDSPQNKETKSDEDDRVVDMEIDMIGGEDLEVHAVPIGSSAGATPSVGYDIPSPKKEPFLDCPPGFEEVYRLKMQKF